VWYACEQVIDRIARLEKYVMCEASTRKRSSFCKSERKNDAGLGRNARVELVSRVNLRASALILSLTKVSRETL
jgi:hypothetical protein